MALGFPLFISLEGKPVTVIGAGKIAARRVKTLLPFGCRITVIAPEVCPELEELAAEGKIALLRRCYAPGDLEGAALAVAAASSRSANQEAGQECRRLGIPVSVADRREECSFYFPAIAREGSGVAGVIAGGENHGLAKRLGVRLREWLHEAVRTEDSNGQ